MIEETRKFVKFNRKLASSRANNMTVAKQEEDLTSKLKKRKVRSQKKNANIKAKENGTEKSIEVKNKDKPYKRSNSKYSKIGVKDCRSNPKYEYCLDDADDNEKELILNGTISDRLNCLALLCARNPTDRNYKQLLQFCENQRNDVIYTTLKLIRDLIKEECIKRKESSTNEYGEGKESNVGRRNKTNEEDMCGISSYIKSRIIKSFDMGVKNQYIKDKVLEIIGVLARAGIYEEDFINILVSRLIEKSTTLKIVENALKSLFSAHEQLIFEGVEDFYYKNDSFRCQHNVLKFLQNLEFKKEKEFFRFYDTALSSLDEEYPQDQRDLMIELLVNGLSRVVSPGDSVTSIDLVRGYIKSSRSIISVLNLLIKTNDPFTDTYVLKVSRTTLLRNTKHEPEFLNMIYKLDNSNLFAKLVDNSFYYSVQSILALLLMAYEKGVDAKTLFSLHLLARHYNPVVRDMSQKLLRKERMPMFDPFDSVYVEGLAKTLSV
ncbi:uncharacterized protein VICG_01822 [Vittaforma corneae ATCC 50505]|uniref:Uncharacterized protein n=1 Tax=Vittaforma corneae (strain ATCC 50505) TaxID=993615 RepID=L2GJS8_VITCO|nr:uncharacterized protein VICG_01822 [Vittaforma corneae ATCC 50505]ELA41123.1 hypothetical protein VICG_01822 [Vittaforma corneae ATCC 50505]